MLGDLALHFLNKMIMLVKDTEEDIEAIYKTIGTVKNQTVHTE